jgi:hypothetical protein
MLAVEQLHAADEQPLSLDGGGGAVAGYGLEGLGRRPADAALLGGLDDSLREGMLGVAFRSSSSSVMPSAVATAATSGSPWVSVPVLSKTTVPSAAACAGGIRAAGRRLAGDWRDGAG